MPPMPRLRLSVLACLAFALTPALRAADLDHTLALQQAMAEARELLTANKSSAAVAVLEKQLASADGNRGYLDLLRSAYAAEVKRLQLTNADPKQVADIRTKLSLIGGSVPATVPPAPEPVATPAPPPPKPATTPAPPSPIGLAAAGEALDTLRQAATLFNEAGNDPKKFGLASRLFKSAFTKRVEMTPEQLAAWAYCRIRLAADQLNHAGKDRAAANQVIAEVEDALKLAPTNAKLQQVGADVIAAARKRGGSRPAPVADGWDVVETASFRVRHHGQRALADAIAQAAEAKRTDIFTRWSGPPGGAWQPKCDITLHSTADAFAQATHQPAAATGHAEVKLDGGRAVERRIDLRADDATAANDALPRELTTVVLADLFPTAAPPRWAEAGMAVLAASPAEVDRYRRTLSRCYRGGELFPVESLLTLKTPTTDRATAFYVESVSLVNFLVRWKGEKAFTAFLRDVQRYGAPAALKRQYGVNDAKQLEDLWTRSELSVSRGQTP
jgi:hypothetical protein